MNFSVQTASLFTGRCPRLPELFRWVKTPTDKKNGLPQKLPSAAVNFPYHSSGLSAFSESFLRHAQSCQGLLKNFFAFSKVGETGRKISATSARLAAYPEKFLRLAQGWQPTLKNFCIHGKVGNCLRNFSASCARLVQRHEIFLDAMTVLSVPAEKFQRLMTGLSEPAEILQHPYYQSITNKTV